VWNRVNTEEHCSSVLYGHLVMWALGPYWTQCIQPTPQYTHSTLITESHYYEALSISINIQSQFLHGFLNYRVPLGGRHRAGIARPVIPLPVAQPVL
jgi:hypothetical protein